MNSCILVQLTLQEALEGIIVRLNPFPFISKHIFPSLSLHLCRIFILFLQHCSGIMLGTSRSKNNVVFLPSGG